MITCPLTCKLLVTEGESLLAWGREERLREAAAGSNAAHGMADTARGEGGDRRGRGTEEEEEGGRRRGEQEEKFFFSSNHSEGFTF